jgi:hypothetical protein
LRRGPFAVALLLAVGGLAVFAYSYDNVQEQTRLFTMGGIILGGEEHKAYNVTVNMDGGYAATVSGYVGAEGCCVEFALLDNSSFSKWIADPEGNPLLPIVHLDSTVVRSQTAQGEFSFKSTVQRDLVLVFVNDEYPATAGFKIHANLDIQYLSLTALYGIGGGSVLMALGVLVAVLSLKKLPRG